MTNVTNEHKIKILRVIARLNIGGPAIHTILLTRYMQSLGYEAILVAGQVEPEEGDMKYLAEAQEVEPIIIPQLGRKLRLFDDLVAFFRILRLIFDFRPDIIHTHTAKAGTLGRAAAFIYNTVQSSIFQIRKLLQRIYPGKKIHSEIVISNPSCKIVHTFHGHVLRGYFIPFKSKMFQLVEKILAKFTDTIVTISEQQKIELCEEFGIGWAEKYRVIPLGFNLTSFVESANHKGQFRANLELPEEEIRLVGIIGRLTPIKNHRLFLKAVKLLVKKWDDKKARFLIVGDGELRAELERLVRQLGLEELVIFTGWIADLAPLYADLDILSLTSDNEGTPVTVIEAMTAGVPVVATNVGGVKELISEHGTTIGYSGFIEQAWNPKLERDGFDICERGVLVESGDAEGFAKGLQFLLERPDVCKNMGKKGREYSLKHHTKERLVTHMDQLYRVLLAGNQKRNYDS